MTGSALPPVSIFIVWVLFLVALIGVIMVYRWRRPDRHSRFQLKLTLTLILFLLIPTVPLVFLAGTVVDQARGFLAALPLDDALQQGLEAVHLALQEEDRRLDAWQAERGGTPPAAGMRPPLPDVTLRFERGQQGWDLVSTLPSSRTSAALADSIRATPPDPRAERPQALADAVFYGSERVFFEYGERGVYMALLSRPDEEAVEGAGVWVDTRLVDARHGIDRGLQSFRTITLLAGTGGTQELLWTLASLWLVILAAGAFLVSRAVARGVSGPVLGLARGMQAVAGGDLSVRVEVPARDEMKFLVESFNTMTVQLKDARERIVSVEKQAAWRDVARRIAHEIKNPLTPLQLGLHRVRSRLQKEEIWGQDEALREALKTMNEEIEALRRMAASFSEFAQLPQPQFRSGDIEDVVRAAAALFEEGPHLARLSVTVRGRIPALPMDADLIKRAIINLIKNATESVEEAGGGEVQIKLEGGREDIVLSIRDTGMGFPPDQAQRIFSPDYTTKARGTGLGLSVVARIIADHDWRIEASSGGPSTGAEMLVRIPLSAGPLRPKPTGST